MPATPSTPRRAVGRARPARTAATRTRLWLEFVNTDAAPGAPRGDFLRHFEALLRWLVEHQAVEADRAAGLARRALLQPAAASAAVLDARRIRSALRDLAEQGATDADVRHAAVGELNRVLGRSAGARRLEERADGTWTRTFVPTGDAFAGLLIPVVESAADALVRQELSRVKVCAAPDCQRVFYDTTKAGTRRWCDMGTCGNRAKAARHRARLRAD
jgi:predicted RNA-binding Zn ribbon-like protein